LSRRSLSRTTAHRTTSDCGEVDVALRIESMSPGDIPAVVGLQVAFLDGSIVTQLGAGFLTRFHTLALDHGASRAFVARARSREIVGFALGLLDVYAFNHYMKPRMLASLVRAVLSPARVRLVGSLARMVAEGDPQPPIPAELLLLVVAPNARRCGVGAALLNAMEDAFAGEAVPQYRVAVRSHLDAARAFYSARDFQLEQQRPVLGRPMVYLTKQVRNR
jgi:ribosomal protein S18 acetylase RimI-like enzyme